MKQKVKHKSHNYLHCLLKNANTCIYCFLIVEQSNCKCKNVKNCFERKIATKGNKWLHELHLFKNSQDTFTMPEASILFDALGLQGLKKYVHLQNVNVFLMSYGVTKKI